MYAQQVAVIECGTAKRRPKHILSHSVPAIEEKEENAE
jgi:hypothetical protein